MRWAALVVLGAAACGDGAPAAVDAAIDVLADSALAALAIAPESHSFGLICLPDSISHDFTVTNNGPGPEPVTASIGGTGAASFMVTSTTCTTLAPGSTCRATVRFHTDSTGGKAATLSVIAPSGAAAVANLDGSGAACSILGISGPLSFGTVAIGTASAVQTVTVTNVSHSVTNGPLFAPELSGAAPGDFEISSTTCTGASLGPGMQCTIDLRFRPTAGGARSAFGSVRTNPTGPIVQVSLSGQGAP